MSGHRSDLARRRGRMTGVLVGIASVSILTACAGGSTPGGEPDPADAIVGTWGSTGESQPHLVFEDDGTVSGTDGCNGVGSTYSVENDAIVLAPFASTLMACEGVDTWLGRVSTVELDGDALIVRDEAGDQIGTLERNDG